MLSSMSSYLHYVNFTVVCFFWNTIKVRAGGRLRCRAPLKRYFCNSLKHGNNSPEPGLARSISNSDWFWCLNESRLVCFRIISVWRGLLSTLMPQSINKPIVVLQEEEESLPSLWPPPPQERPAQGTGWRSRPRLWSVHRFTFCKLPTEQIFISSLQLIRFPCHCVRSPGVQTAALQAWTQTQNSSEKQDYLHGGKYWKVTQHEWKFTNPEGQVGANGTHVEITDNNISSDQFLGGPSRRSERFEKAGRSLTAQQVAWKQQQIYSVPLLLAC